MINPSFMLRLFLIAILVTGTSVGVVAQNDLQRNHLLGRVKSIKHNWDDTVIKQTEFFNTFGNKIEEQAYYQGQIIDTTRYKYDNQNRLVEETSISWKTIYSYDAQHHIIESNRSRVDNGVLVEKMLFRQSNAGDDSEVFSYSGSGDLNYRKMIEIDGKGDRKEISYDAAKKIERVEEIKYNKDKTESSSTEFFGDTYDNVRFEISDQTEYIYESFDKMGNWTRRRMKSNRNGRTTEYIQARIIEYY